MILKVYNTTDVLFETKPLNEKAWDFSFLYRNGVSEVCPTMPTKSGAAATLCDALLQFCI